MSEYGNKMIDIATAFECRACGCTLHRVGHVHRICAKCQVPEYSDGGYKKAGRTMDSNEKTAHRANTEAE